MINLIDTQDKRKIGYNMSPQIRISDKLYKHLKNMNAPMSKSLDKIVLGDTEDFSKKPTKFRPPYMFIYASILNCWIEYVEVMMPQGSSTLDMILSRADIRDRILPKIDNNGWFKSVIRKGTNHTLHFFDNRFETVLDNALGTMVKLGYMSRQRIQSPTERVVGIPYEYKLNRIPRPDVINGIIANSTTAAESRVKQNDGTFPKLADLFQSN